MTQDRQKAQNGRSEGDRFRGRKDEQGRRKGRRPDGKGRRDDKSGDRAGGGAASAAHRVLAELSVLEKALVKNDFQAQIAPLDEIAKALRPLRLKSIDDLDMNTKGRLITSLLRVTRQPKPPEPVVSAAVTATEGETPSTPEGTSSETVGEATGSVSAVAEATTVTPEDTKYKNYQDMMFRVGRVWRAVADERRAAIAFSASGKEDVVEEAVKTLHRAGDWQEEAKALEDQGKTHMAARLYQKHKRWEDAFRLFESSKDFKSALQCALALKHQESIDRLSAQVNPRDVQFLFEKAGAWELLMKRFVEAKDYEGVAKLYERARQFDQAALAWERAQKWAQARKAYERARDLQGVARVRELETRKLVERGDRLGAAILWVAAGEKAKAVEVLTALPGPKAFRFLQKARLEDEAVALARKEIARADAENRPSQRARWLELLGEPALAADAWLEADRKDKAQVMYEQVGNWQRAAELAEALSLLDKAEELYHRAGDKASAERVKVLPRVAVVDASSSSNSEPDDEEGESKDSSAPSP